MCMTAANALLSKTAVYCGETLLADGSVGRVTIYENTATDLNRSGGNAMLLAVPTDGPVSFLDLSECPHVLKDMREALPAPRNVAKSFSLGDRGLDDEVAVSQCGIYTCLAAPPNVSAAAIREAIRTKVPTDQQPPLSDAYIESVRGAYRGAGAFVLVIACFSNKDAAEAHPLAYAYAPTDAKTLFFPGLDDHTGEGPRQGTVERDHVLLAGSYLKTGGATVFYTDELSEEARTFLPTHVGGDFVSGDRPNSDWILPVETARGEALSISCFRVIPAGLA